MIANDPRFTKHFYVMQAAGKISNGLAGELNDALENTECHISDLSTSETSVKISVFYF